MKKLMTLLLMVTFITIVACSKSDSGTTNNGSGSGTGGTTLNCNTIDSRFAAVVFPIIQNNCNSVGCHATGSSNGPGALTNFDQIKAAAAQIRSSVESGTMPKNGALTTAQKNAISCWVASGALNN
jgi:hypothetical protein